MSRSALYTILLHVMGWVLPSPALPQTPQNDSSYYAISIYKTLPQSQQEPLDGYGMSASISPDGRLAAVATHKGYLYVMDIDQDSLIWTEKHPALAYDMAFTQNNRYLVATRSDSINFVWILDLFHLNENKEKPDSRIPIRSQKPIRELAISPPEEHLERTEENFHIALAIRDSIVIGDVFSRTWTHYLPKAHKQPVKGLAFSPDGKYLLSGGKDKRLVLWDWRKKAILGEKNKAHNQRITTVALSQRSSTLMAISGGHEGFVYVWEIPTKGENPFTFNNKDRYRHETRVRESIESLAIHPNALFLVSGGQDNAFRTWNLAEAYSFSDSSQYLRVQPEYKEFLGIPLDIEFDSLGRRMITVDYRDQVQIWQVQKRNAKNKLTEPKISWISPGTLTSELHPGDSVLLRAQLISNSPIDSIFLRINGEDKYLGRENIQPDLASRFPFWEQRLSYNELKGYSERPLRLQLYALNSVGTSLSKPLIIFLRPQSFPRSGKPRE